MKGLLADEGVIGWGPLSEVVGATLILEGRRWCALELATEQGMKGDDGSQPCCEELADEESVIRIRELSISKGQ
jgi:hypothetical protein